MNAENMQKIEISEIDRFINKPVHLAWANRGCVWILLGVVQGYAVCRTKTSGKVITSKVEDLRKVNEYSNL